MYMAVLMRCAMYPTVPGNRRSRGASCLNNQAEDAG